MHISLPTAQNILFVEGGLPSPYVDAGSLANLELIMLLQSLGNQIYYLYTGHNPLGSQDALIKAGCVLIDGSAMTRTQQEVILKTHATHFAILSRPGPALQWIEILRACLIPTVYFGHDVHHERLIRAHALNPTDSLQSYLIHKSIETYLWNMVDVVVYPTRWECDYAQKLSGRRHVVWMPIYDVEAICRLKSELPHRTKPLLRNHQQVSRLLFVGGSNHMPNLDGLLWFLEVVMPRLTVDIELNVVGKWHEEAQLRLQDAANKYLGPISSMKMCGSVVPEVLLQHYADADLVIAPLRFGAGLKRKVIEALMLERPLLTTPAGVEGINFSEVEKSYLSSDVDGEQFAQAMMQRLASSQDENQKHSKVIAHHVARLFSREERLESLAKIFAILKSS